MNPNPMRAFIKGKYVELADFQLHEGRDLVRVDISYCDAQEHNRSLGLRNSIALAKKRLYQVPEVLFYDGIRHLVRKTDHMLRREMLGLDRQVASFYGNKVVASQASNEVEASVYGVTANHPQCTDLVLARPQFVLPSPPGADPYLLALAWPGLIAMAVLSVARRAQVQRVRLLGRASRFPLLHWMLTTEFGDGKVLWGSPENAKRQVNAVGDGELIVATTPLANNWQEFKGPVLGLGMTSRDMERCFPACDPNETIDYKTFLSKRFDPYLVDLFYDDGQEIYPFWFSAQMLASYGDFISRNSERKRPQALSPSTSSPLNGGMTVESAPSQIRWVTFGHSATEGFTTRKVQSIRTFKRNTDRIGVGLIGGGRWPLGMIVRQMAADPRIRLRGVCDRRPEVAYLASSALPFDYHTTDPEEILDDVETQIIVVAPYHGFHAEFAAEAVRRGKFCFLEKPPAINLAQLRRLASAANNTNSLYVGYNRRFSPLTDHMCKHLGGEVGPFYMDFVMRSLDLPKNHWYYWPSNGSRIVANCCHMIDLACQVASPATPTSVISAPADPQQIDRDVSIIIRFNNGSLSTISYISRGRVRHGYFQKYLIARGEMFCEIDGYKTLKITRNSRVVSRKKVLRDMGHRAQVRKFLDNVIDHGQSPVPFRHALVSALTVLAADESARHGGAVTPLATNGFDDILG